MKNIIKWFMVIALVTIVGFSFVTCDNDDSSNDNSSNDNRSVAIVKIINNYNKPITKVVFGTLNHPDSTEYENQNIVANGGNKSYNYDLGKNVIESSLWVTLFAEGLDDSGYTANYSWVKPGKTTTYTLGSNGEITAQRP